MNDELGTRDLFGGSAPARSEAERSESNRGEPERTESGRSESGRSESERSGVERSGVDRSGMERIAPKEYYSMGEVCDLVGLKPHVLRYWESQFPVLNPSKNRSGNRVFQRKEIKLILLVKHLLYTEKYTIEGARQKLEGLRKERDLRPSADRNVGPGLADELRQELEDLHALLSRPLGAAE